MRTVAIRLPLAAAEALSDAQEGEAGDWPDDWPDHGEAHTMALAAVDEALNHEAVEPACPVCAGYAVDQAIAVLHSALIRAAADADASSWGTRFMSLTAAGGPGRPTPWPSSPAATWAASSPCSRPWPTEIDGYAQGHDASAVNAAGRREITTISA
jgi:hypothetical protein